MQNTGIDVELPFDESILVLTYKEEGVQRTPSRFCYQNPEIGQYRKKEAERGRPSLKPTNL
jgi:hypothetical protein